MAVDYSTTAYTALSLGDPGVQDAKVQGCWAPKQEVLGPSKDQEEQSPRYTTL